MVVCVMARTLDGLTHAGDRYLISDRDLDAVEGCDAA